MAFFIISLKGMREQAIHITEARLFQAEQKASANTLRWKADGHIQGTTNRQGG